MIGPILSLSTRAMQAFRGTTPRTKAIMIGAAIAFALLLWRIWWLRYSTNTASTMNFPSGTTSSPPNAPPTGTPSPPKTTPNVDLTTVGASGQMPPEGHAIYKASPGRPCELSLVNETSMTTERLAMIVTDHDIRLDILEANAGFEHDNRYGGTSGGGGFRNDTSGGTNGGTRH